MQDRTNYFQSVIHVLKGNLGTGMLAMPMSFKHLGFLGAILALPILCLISAYCTHVLIRSARRAGKRSNEQNLNYSQLTCRAFEHGPRWLAPWANLMGRLTGFALLVTQIGACCVYIVFVADNITNILASYHMDVSSWLIVLAIYPIAVLLGCIRTLNRLAIASMIANLLQIVGLVVIVNYLLRDASQLTLKDQKHFGTPREMALGFGSAMFAFEGISVVLPVYNRIKRREQFGSLLGVINVSFVLMFFLYFTIGLLGYMRFGSHVKDSITLNLPAEPMYDGVRIMFILSTLLTYPLQCWVPNEMSWQWWRRKLARQPPVWQMSGRDSNGESDKKISIIVAASHCNRPDGLPQQPSPVAKFNVTKMIGDGKKFNGLTDKTNNRSIQNFVRRETRMSTTGSHMDLVTDTNSIYETSSNDTNSDNNSVGNPPLRYEYYSRISVVTSTFALALGIPKLNLLMDLVGSFSGNLLCLTIPAAIHLVSYSGTTLGYKKWLIVVLDTSIVTFSLIAGLGGSYSSVLMMIGIN